MMAPMKTTLDWKNTANNKVPNQDDVGQESDNSNNEVENLAT